MKGYPTTSMTHLYLTRTLVLAAALAAAACGATPTQPPPTAATSTSPGARAYLDRLITVTRANSLTRLTIDWNAFTTAVFAEAASAQTIPDTYPAIRKALELLGDGHSSYRTPSGTYLLVRLRPCTASGASAPTVPADIGYVKVTA